MTSTLSSHRRVTRFSSQKSVFGIEFFGSTKTLVETGIPDGWMDAIQFVLVKTALSDF